MYELLCILTKLSFPVYSCSLYPIESNHWLGVIAKYMDVHPVFHCFFCGVIVFEPQESEEVPIVLTDNEAVEHLFSICCDG